MTNIIERFKMAITSFREGYVVSEQQYPEDFEDFDARRARYEILWAQYGNDVYRDVHTWAKTYRQSYGLYRYIRNIYNPAYRLCNIHQTHIWGGQLDPGAKQDGALPILTGNNSIRGPIAELWSWSNWQVRKDIVTLHGAVLGDVILRVVDRPWLEKVYIELLHPGVVKELVKDEFGNVKGYTLQEEREHPENPTRTVTYTEEAWREGQNVVYATYLNNTPYPWNGVAAQWSEPYGFVPMVHIQHNDVGLQWGWSELQPARSKMHELDDLASMLTDQMRKTVNPAWLFAGFQKSQNISTSQTAATTTTPYPEREEIAAFYVSDPNARAQPLVAEIDFEGVVKHIREIMSELERDYPELRFDQLRVSENASGELLRVARQPVESKIQQRRANYDGGLVKIHQMALSIGGFRGYWPFTLDSYSQGRLDHTISERPVFFTDLVDDLSEELVFWQVADAAKKVGVPLDVYLARAGWDESEIAPIKAAIEQNRAMMAQQMQPRDEDTENSRDDRFGNAGQ